MPRLLDPLVTPLTDLLMLLTSVLHSYGLAIIVFTILVRAALTPLTLRQLRSAKRMAALAPHLKQLQQTYKGNCEELVRGQKHGPRSPGPGHLADGAAPPHYRPHPPRSFSP